MRSPSTTFILSAGVLLALYACNALGQQADKSREPKVLYLHLYSNRYDITTMRGLPSPPRDWQCIATVSVVSGHPFYFDIPCHYEPHMRMEGEIVSFGKRVETDFTIDVTDVGPAYRHVQKTPLGLDTLHEFGDAEFKLSVSSSRKPPSVRAKD